MIINVFGTKYDTDEWNECFVEETESNKEIAYFEPADYIPEEIRKECKLGEYADEEPWFPRKSVVDIRFENGKKLSYYNDKFDLHVGDIVYVDGKLEGIKGRVVEVNYNFKIKLSDYKKVITLVDTDIHGKLFMAGSHFMAFNSETLPKEKVKLWFIPPQNEGEEIISGNDERSFNLDDLKGMKISEEIAERGYDYYIENKVAYLELNKNKGYAIVEGTKPYEIEFKYEDGKISNLTCDCFCTYKCKHEFATMLQLKESLEQIEKYFSKEYEQTQYFSAIRKGTFFALAIDGKEGKSFEI